MESHLTSLARTVAQITNELKTMKSVEDVICDLRREVKDMKNLKLGTSSLNKPNELGRSNSEPNILNSVVNTFTAKGSDNDNETKEQRKLEFLKEKEKIRSVIPTYTNPRKLKKLTK